MTAPTIAIIGGGPCGLTLARLLQCKGIDYVVYERDESENSNRAGGSLDIHPETGQHALRECGLFDEFKRYARYDDTLFALADKLGKRLLQLGQGRDAPEIDRSELRQLLLDVIPKDKIKWGHALTSATVSEDNRPVLQFANGVVLSGFKLVVGADGAWSKVRPMV
jgi:2-polyprenyl-6-methoxyphenol hydroxylase-like FAD-dependent oxidoreductase